MMLRDDMERSGNWLFRYRSFVPIPLFVALAVAMYRFRYFGGTHNWDIVWDVVCVALSFGGLTVRAITIGYTPSGTSGRNTDVQIAQTLNTAGMYSIVRHPLYLGNYLMWLGIAMFPHKIWLPVFVSLMFWIYYERIILAEEQFLNRTFGEAFQRWASTTPVFLPNPFLWKPPPLSFSLRNVLKREYSGMFVLVVVFTALEVVGEYQVDQNVELEPGWAIFFVTGLLAYAVLRILRRHTRVLKVQGR